MPEAVRRAIQERAAQAGFATLKSAAAQLSDAYREGRAFRLTSEERVTAYLVTRMPATYAANFTVLREVRSRLGERSISSVLDVGAGTGAASLAARHWFPDARITLMEREAAMLDAAREWLPDASAEMRNVTSMPALPPHDLVIAAYSLGEFDQAMAARLWEAARVACVVIEPGTPKGFAAVLAVRAEWLAAAAHIAAPCPAETPCPLAPPDWCHFAARVERTSVHRRLKDAALGYEDEKYSYIAMARQAVTPANQRVIRRPQHQPGLVILETCTARGVVTRRVSKRDRDAFRAARQAAWGDADIS